MCFRLKIHLIQQKLNIFPVCYKRSCQYITGTAETMVSAGNAIIEEKFIFDIILKRHGDILVLYIPDI